MPLDTSIRDRLVLPAVCAPMFLVSNPAMVKAACKSGIIGALPRQNARSFEIFESWLKDIREDLDAHAAANPGARVGPLAVNLATKLSAEDAKALSISARGMGSRSLSAPPAIPPNSPRGSTIMA